MRTYDVGDLKTTGKRNRRSEYLDEAIEHHHHHSSKQERAEEVEVIPSLGSKECEEGEAKHDSGCQCCGFQYH